MKRFSDMKRHAILAVLGGALALTASAAGALDVYLATKAFTKTMPDSSAVPMWGYVLDVDGDSNGVGDCWEAANEADRLACIDTLPMPSIPGPRLTVPPGDASLTINLSNGLLEPTSLIIPGQALPVGSAATFIEPTDPTTVAATGTRTTLTQRFRSYGNEAAGSGGTQTYTWSLARSGSFIYHSGTWPQKQVYMGLYGAMTRDFAPGEVYEGVPYANEVMLFYSDIDPVLNSAIADGSYATSIDYHAQWFLVNGEPYVAGVTADIPAGAAGETTLLRLLSTASETHVPTLQGLYMHIEGEDGYRYNWQDTTAGTAGFSPREQFTAMLPALKTKDAILTLPASEGRFAVYDGNGYMTNPSDPNDFAVADSLGGMLRFLATTAGGGNTPPVAVDDTATTPFETLVTIDVLANDTDADGDTLSIGASDAASASGGTVSCTATCDYAPPTGFSGTDTFTYQASDGTDLSNVATVTITVEAAPNTPPVAVDDAYGTLQDVALTVPAPGVLGNDSDADGDALTAALATSTANGSVVLGSDGSFSYTPNAGFFGTDSFTYVAFDGTDVSNPATVTITVTQATKHVGDLDGSAIPRTSTWRATVMVTVHDQDHAPLEGAVVAGAWTVTNGSTVNACTTDAAGQCEVTSTYGLGRTQVTFTVNDLSGAGGAYVAADNHDPDGDSDGTSITILRP
jgi:hypothetical protein